MFKALIQGGILIASFFCTWLLLSTISWTEILKTGHLANVTEEKLGDMYWDMIKNSEKEIQSTQVTLPLDSILSKICISNSIDKSLFKLHIIESDETNAFALPNKHIVIYSNLIVSAKNEAELSGVICHEIAHIEQDHIMKRLVKEFGLFALISIATGNNNTQIIKETIKLLSSTAYDRSLEKEADIKAVEYLTKSNINPESFASFLYRLGENEPASLKFISWASTHPDSKERAEYIMNRAEKGTKYSQQILSLDTWVVLKNILIENQKTSPEH